jgi:hypothetical protein
LRTAASAQGSDNAGTWPHLCHVSFLPPPEAILGHEGKEGSEEAPRGSLPFRYVLS